MCETNLNVAFKSKHRLICKVHWSDPDKIVPCKPKVEGLVPLFVDQLFMNSGLEEQGVDGEESTKGILPSAAFT